MAKGIILVACYPDRNAFNLLDLYPKKEGFKYKLVRTADQVRSYIFSDYITLGYNSLRWPKEKKDLLIELERRLEFSKSLRAVKNEKE